MAHYDSLHQSPLEKLLWALEETEEEVATLPRAEIERQLEAMGVDYAATVHSIERLVQAYLGEDPTSEKAIQRECGEHPQQEPSLSTHEAPRQGHSIVGILPSRCSSSLCHAGAWEWE
jgi:hypothetical protein